MVLKFQGPEFKFCIFLTQALHENNIYNPFLTKCKAYLVKQNSLSTNGLFQSLISSLIMVNQPLIFNLLGVVLLTAAFVLHTVCLTTPYYSAANMNDFAKEIRAIAQTDPSRLGLGADISQEQLKEAVESRCLHSCF